MRIPEAREQQVNIAPRVSAPEVLSPVITNNGAYEAGMEMQRALSNASDGFVKMYVADQRADAIHAFDDYSRQMNELLSSADKGDPKKAALDPKTGLPVGFLQLQGDQINEGNLQLWQQKALNLRTEFNKKISKSIPDIKDEFSRRADKTDEDFNLKTNAHFLKGKYEKAKNAALLDNSNKINNKVLDLSNPEDIADTYDQIYKNYLIVYQSEDSALRAAENDWAKLIENNVTRIIQTRTPLSYEDAKGFLKNPAVRQGVERVVEVKQEDGTIKKEKKRFGGLSDSAYATLTRKVDLESVEWQMEIPTTTTESITHYINNYTDHLTLKEKAKYVSKAIENDNRRAASGKDKKTSLYSSLLNWIETSDHNVFSNDNKYGINKMLLDAGGKKSFKGVTELEASEFRSDFLAFSTDLFSRITDSNQERLVNYGVEGVFEKADLDVYKNKSALMKNAINQVNAMFKSGELYGLTSQQVGFLKTEINNIRTDNKDYHAQLEKYQLISKGITDLAAKKDDFTPKDLETAITLYNDLEGMIGGDVAHYGDANVVTLQRTISDIIHNNAEKTILAEDTTWNKRFKYFSKLGKRLSNKIYSFDDIFKKGITKEQSEKNHTLISRLIPVAYSSGRKQNGGQDVLPELYREALNFVWAIEEGNGVTGYRLTADGQIDPSTREERMVMRLNARNDNDTNGDIEGAIIKALSKESKYLNRKYNTKRFNSFAEIDRNDLSDEDIKHLHETLRRELMTTSGKEGYTFIQSPDWGSFDLIGQLKKNPLFFGTKYTNAVAGTALKQASKVAATAAFPAFSKLPDVYTDFKEKKPDLKDNAYLASINYDLDVFSSNTFKGGAANHEEIVSLVSEGYTSYEDYLYQINKQENIVDDKSMQMNWVLNAVTPYGLETIYSDPDDAYLSRFAGELAYRLAQDNPGTDPHEFLMPYNIGFNVSKNTLKFVEENYGKIRKKQIEKLKKRFFDNFSLARPAKYEVKEAK